MLVIEDLYMKSFLPTSILDIMSILSLKFDVGGIGQLLWLWLLVLTLICHAAAMPAAACTSSSDLDKVCSTCRLHLDDLAAAIAISTQLCSAVPSQAATTSQLALLYRILAPLQVVALANTPQRIPNPPAQSRCKRTSHIRRPRAGCTRTTHR